MHYTKLAFIITATLLASNPATLQASVTTMPRYALRIPFSPVVVGLATLVLAYKLYQGTTATLQRLHNINQSVRELANLTPARLEEVRIEKELKAFLARTQPCPELARPGIIHRDNSNGGHSWQPGKDNPLLTTTQRDLTPTEKHFASMLGGYKHVFLPFRESLNDVFDEPTQKAILKKHGITTVSYTMLNGMKQQLLFTEQGRIHALLILKDSHSCLPRPCLPSRINGDHLTGLLLGYQLKDINAFLHKINVCNASNPPLTQEQLDISYNHALAWIKDNTPGIEEWIRDNTRRLNIKFS